MATREDLSRLSRGVPFPSCNGFGRVSLPCLGEDLAVASAEQESIGPVEAAAERSSPCSSGTWLDAMLGGPKSGESLGKPEPDRPARVEPAPATEIWWLSATTSSSRRPPSRQANEPLQPSPWSLDPLTGDKTYQVGGCRSEIQRASPLVSKSNLRVLTPCRNIVTMYPLRCGRSEKAMTATGIARRQA